MGMSSKLHRAAVLSPHTTTHRPGQFPTVLIQSANLFMFSTIRKNCHSSGKESIPHALLNSINRLSQVTTAQRVLRLWMAVSHTVINQLQGAEAHLKKRLVPQLVKISHFVGTKGSLSCSQQSASCPYPEPD